MSWPKVVICGHDGSWCEYEIYRRHERCEARREVLADTGEVWEPVTRGKHAYFEKGNPCEGKHLGLSRMTG